MSSPVTESAFAPVISLAKEGGQKYLRDCSDMTRIALESTALWALTSATIRVLPFVLFSEAFSNNDLVHHISSRGNYKGVVWISFGDFIHNYVMSLFYSAAFVVTLGLSNEINYSFQKHWINLGFSSLCLVISSIGTIIPSLGVLLNKELVVAVISSVQRSYQDDLTKFENEIVEWIQEIFEKNRSLLENISKDYYKEKYQREVFPSIKYIAQQLNQAEKIQDIFQVFFAFKREWPRMGPRFSRGEESVLI